MSGAKVAARRSLGLGPGFVEVLVEYAELLAGSEANGDLARTWARVRELDPLHPLARAHGGELVREALTRVYGS